MRLDAGKIVRGVEYVDAFGTKDTPMVFTPMGQFVRLSVYGDAYGEYLMECNEPLLERFAVPKRVMLKIARELGGDDFVYTKVNAGRVARIDAGSRSWSLNTCGFGVSRPEVNASSEIEWDSSFAKVLALVKSSALQEASGGCLDCVSVEKRPMQKVMAATNKTMMTVCVEEVNIEPQGVEDDDEYDQKLRESQRQATPDCARVLIERTAVPLVEKTCDAGGGVVIKSGINFFSVESGRKTGVFPARPGTVPRWKEEVRKASNLDRCGEANIDASFVYSAANQASIAGSSVEIEGSDRNLFFRSKSDDGGLLEFVTGVDWLGPIPRCKVNASFLKELSRAWPSEKMQIVFQGNRYPLVLKGKGDGRKVVSVIAPIV